MKKITVSIRFFAMMREIVGRSRILCEFDENLSVFDVITEIAKKIPELRHILFSNNKINTSLVFALNGKSVEFLSNIIKENDELTIIPPTGGG